jgi:hypothetical protein
MEGSQEPHYWTRMMTNEVHIAGIDDLAIPTMTAGSQQPNDMSFEFEEDDTLMQSVDGTPSEVEHVEALTPTQGAPRSRAIRPNQKRTKNFDQNEDEAVCNAWLKTGKDPVHGANQRRDTFWGRVRVYFNTH